MTVDLRRTRSLNTHSYVAGKVCYWMSRDQRIHDNWALLFAQQKALQLQVPFIICFSMVKHFLGSGARQYAFMSTGLMEVHQELRRLGIPFFLLEGEPTLTLPELIDQQGIGLLVTDFSPLRVGCEWRERVAAQIHVPMTEVDAHNIVPVWVASPKQEFGAYTFRPKIRKLLPEFLTEFPKVVKMDQPTELLPTFSLLPSAADSTDWILPGQKAAHQALDFFLKEKLSVYANTRNDPTQDGQSNLSPYLHFGQISAQRVALEVEKAGQSAPVSRDAFLEELIVRRELADNFCFYNPSYDMVAGFPEWARKTLQAHLQDTRSQLYALEELERADTHDPAWNAAQKEMIHRGKLHGYMRMYWAKKILEWSTTPEQALSSAIFLNDKYLLDGRDPNGYTGIAWSIGGVHDRPWFEREVFGKVRYMNFSGLKRKFNVQKYIEMVNQDWTSRPLAQYEKSET